MSTTTPTGQWYLGVMCAGCATPILFQAGSSEGVDQWAGQDSCELQCQVPSCSLHTQRRRYLAAQFLHVRIDRFVHVRIDRAARRSPTP
jgi:hypothetical protein